MQLNVFSQTNKSRVFVGTLWQNKEEYCFKYDLHYTRLKTGIPLGPELPKYKVDVFRSKKLFPFFAERIPSKQNPEYPNYCRQWGISPKENNLLVLLSTIGNRGPSSFIFRKKEEITINGAELMTFRKKLGLSLREFAVFVDIQPATLSKTENGKFSSTTFFRLMEMLINVKEALEHQLHLRGQYLHDHKISGIKKYLA